MSLLLTITGPSCSGKTTLLQLLCEKYGFSQILSTMTRPIRPGEVEGIHGYFVSKERFAELVDSGEMSQHINFSGELYGSTWAEVERIVDMGRTPSVIVEPNGVPQYGAIAEKLGLQKVSIYVQSRVESLVDRYCRRRLGEVVSAEEDTYHAKRLASIMSEYENWSTAAEYDHFIENCGTVEGLDNLAQQVNNLVNEVKVYGKSRA